MKFIYIHIFMYRQTYRHKHTSNIPYKIEDIQLYCKTTSSCHYGYLTIISLNLCNKICNIYVICILIYIKYSY